MSQTPSAAVSKAQNPAASSLVQYYFYCLDLASQFNTSDQVLFSEGLSTNIYSDPDPLNPGARDSTLMVFLCLSLLLAKAQPWDKTSNSDIRGKKDDDYGGWHCFGHVCDSDSGWRLGPVWLVFFQAVTSAHRGAQELTSIVMGRCFGKHNLHWSVRRQAAILHPHFPCHWFKAPNQQRT